MKSYFEEQSSHYHVFRPDYPTELYTEIYSHVSAFELGVDVACGSGQATRSLAQKFAKIIAIDNSKNQLEQMAALSNVQKLHLQAEEISQQIEPDSVDLLVVAQAFHWFRHIDFFKALLTVLKKNSTFAVWGYNKNSILFTDEKPDSQSQAVFEDFYSNIVGSYWPPERVHIESQYKNIVFPNFLTEIPVQKKFQIERRMSRADFLGYLSSWSATTLYTKDKGVSPIESCNKTLSQYWPDNEARMIVWPIFIRTFKNSG